MIILKHLFKRGCLQKNIVAIIVLISSISLQSKAQLTEKHANVDILIAMDLSGSTNGLLENFRDKMWDIINQWKFFKPTPSLRIGFVGFSRMSFPSSEGYVKILCDLTDDYDVLSKELNSMRPYVENGYQFVGSAMNTSIENLNWNNDAGTLKMIFVVGNGMANVGTVNYRAVCETAVKNNIIINTIYCTKTDRQSRSKEIPAWNEIAELTNGENQVITINKRIPLISMREDLVTLAALNDSLNKTCIAYGRNGIDKYKLMLECDANSLRVYDSYFYSRLKYKLSDHYRNKQLTWDIVTYKQFYPESRLAAVKSSAKNDNSGVNLEELVLQNLNKRNKIIGSMQTIFPENAEQYIHDETSKEDFETGNMLDRAFISIFYRQAIAHGFEH